jgi:hypothetical protein
MKKLFTQDQMIRGGLLLVIAVFVFIGLFRQFTRTGGSAWDAWKHVVGVFFLLPAAFLVIFGIVSFFKERRASLPAGQRFDRRWVLVPLFGILALVHLLQLFIIPMRAMEIFYNGAFIENTLRRAGFSSLMAPVYLAFIITIFIMLRYSFIIVAFYLFRAIDRIFIDVRSTVDYILMIASPLVYFFLISIFEKGELANEILEMATGIMLSHYLAISVCWAIVRHRSRAGQARASYLLTQFGGGLVMFALAVTSLWFYLAYLAIETDLFWRLVFHGFLLSGAYGSFRFYYKHADELWAAKEEMDD